MNKTQVINGWTVRLMRWTQQGALRQVLSICAPHWLWRLDVLAQATQRHAPGLRVWDWPLERSASQMAELVVEAIRRAPRPQGIAPFTLKLVGLTGEVLSQLDAEWTEATPCQVGAMLAVGTAPGWVRLVLYGELAVVTARRRQWSFALLK